MRCVAHRPTALRRDPNYDDVSIDISLPEERLRYLTVSRKN